MERHFFTKGCQHLGSAAASDDQLLDTIRAAALLSIYMYTRSRYHEVSSTRGSLVNKDCANHCNLALRAG